MIYLVLLILFFVIYTSWRVDKVAGVFGEAIDKFNEEIEELKALANKPEASILPEDWSSDRWAGEPTKEETTTAGKSESVEGCRRIYGSGHP